NFGGLRSFHLQNADEPALGARQRMVDQDVVAGNIELELDDGGASSRHGDGLDSFRRRAEQAGQIVDAVEYLADDMKGRGVVRTADAEENADGFADIGAHGMQLRQGADGAVEDEVFGPLVQQLVDAELLAAALPERRVGIDLSLHDVEFAVDRRQ